MPLKKLSNKQKQPKLQTELDHQVFEFDAIGTSWSIIIEQPITKVMSKKLLKFINKRIDEFDLNYSRFRSDSLITKMSESAATYILPKDAELMFNLYNKLYELSDGLVTPLIGQVLSDAGYDSNYSLKSGVLKDTPSWDQTLVYNFPTLSIKEPVLIDIGAAGKGYLVDIIAKLIEQHGITKFCINAGGDIVNKNVSYKLSEVGLEHPLELDEVIGVASVNNKSICGSAPNRRAWENFSHIINPSTKTSPDHILAVWVVADNAMIADGLTTALFFVEPSVLKSDFDFEFAIVLKDLSLVRSANFPAKFF